MTEDEKDEFIFLMNKRINVAFGSAREAELRAKWVDEQREREDAHWGERVKAAVAGGMASPEEIDAFLIQANGG